MVNLDTKNNNMHTFWILLNGFIGFIVFKLANFGISGKKSKKSPTNFNFKYWISDQNNWNDIVFGLILFYLIITYKNTLFSMFPNNLFVSFLAPYKDEELFIIIIGFLMTFIIKMVRNGIKFLTSSVK